MAEPPGRSGGCFSTLMRLIKVTSLPAPAAQRAFNLHVDCSDFHNLVHDIVARCPLVSHASPLRPPASSCPERVLFLRRRVGSKSKKDAGISSFFASTSPGNLGLCARTPWKDINILHYPWSGEVVVVAWFFYFFLRRRVRR